MAERRLGIVKRITLAGFAEGWDESCYVLSTPVTYGQLKSIRSLGAEDMDEDAGLEAVITFVKEHIVGGKVKVLGEGEELELANLEPADVDQMTVEMVNHLFAEMTGVGGQYSDPKASPTVQRSSDVSSSTSGPSVS